MLERAVEKFDVAVVGGGIAGAAAAIALRNGGFSVAIIERADYNQKRIPEILPPDVKEPLIALGIWDDFLSLGCKPVMSRVSSWGSPHLDVSDYLFNAYGPAWLIVRPTFDRFLATGASERGARLFLNTRITAYLREGRRCWQLTLRQNLEELSIKAAFVVVATGRSSSVMRRGPKSRTSYDRLIGLTATIAHSNMHFANDARPMVEAAPEGWWYSVGLPDETISLALMTDADIAGAEVRRYNNRGAMLAALLSHAPHTFERLRADLDVLIHANVVSANTYLNSSLDDDGVISIGDAASAIDPLAGQGSYVALESSTSIAATVAAYNRGSLTALEEYSQRQRARFERHAAERIAYYSVEKRWPRFPFWSRRQTAR
jgi:2-polyprenyl-6-methoxyphenol hydroxylase-like FAD-dependent oxidoreductase